MPSPDAKALLAARARRLTAIRRRIAAAVIASFALAWGVIAWDGAMGAETTTTAQVTTSATATPTASTDDGSSAPDDSSTLTTSQS
jgi:hypothetical protein